MLRKAVGLVLFQIVLIGLVVQSVYAQDTPITKTLDPGQCEGALFSVTLPEAPLPELDVVFVIDVTGSMSDEIRAATDSSEKIAADIRRISADSRFALITMADYEGVNGLLEFLLDTYGAADDYPWRLDQDFTSDTTALKNALSSIELLSGGDSPESYLRALYEASYLDWRTDARRAVILIGDAPPHDPDPGVDSLEDTADDLTEKSVEERLLAEGITVLGVSASSGSRSYFSRVASATGGGALDLNEASQVASLIESLLIENLAVINDLSLSSNDGKGDWIVPVVSQHTDVPPGSEREFSMNICAPENAKAGEYTDFVVSVYGDDALISSVPVQITVNETAVAGFEIPEISLPEPSLPRMPALPVGFLAGLFGNLASLWWVPLLLLLLFLCWLLYKWLTRPKTEHRGRPGVRQGGAAEVKRKVEKTPGPSSARASHGRESRRPKERDGS